MDTGEQEPSPRSIALPLAMAAVAILLLGWALVASQARQRRKRLQRIPPLRILLPPQAGAERQARHPLQPLQPHTRPPGTAQPVDPTYQLLRDSPAHQVRAA